LTAEISIAAHDRDANCAEQGAEHAGMKRIG